ncbi:hypothetical protein C8J57DRAFT_1313410 [Mycena rebaudengoi]|nr:hypothetical protein C8J57DRAFT_1313410 [Mycena rebaudengoi]
MLALRGLLLRSKRIPSTQLFPRRLPPRPKTRALFHSAARRTPTPWISIRRSHAAASCFIFGLVSGWAGYSFYNLRAENHALRELNLLFARLCDLQCIDFSYSAVRFETFPEALEYFSKLLCAVASSERMISFLVVIEELSRWGPGDTGAAHAIICEACEEVHKLLDGTQGQDSIQLCKTTLDLSILLLLDAFSEMIDLVLGTLPDSPVLREAQDPHQASVISR